MGARNYKDRLKLFIEGHLELSVTAFEDRLGLSHGRIQKIIGSSKHIKVDLLEKIFAEFPTLDANWLFKGSGHMLRAYPELEDKIITSKAADDNVLYIKEVGMSSEELKDMITTAKKLLDLVESNKIVLKRASKNSSKN